MSERVVGMGLKRVVSRSCMSRVSRRRVLRDVSQQGSLGEPRRKRKERERKESKTSLGEMERDVRDVEKGMEQGRTSGYAAMTATRGTPTAPATVLSHTRRRSLTTQLTTKRHFSQRHPTPREREINGPCLNTLHLGNMHLARRRCGSHDDVSSSHSLPTPHRLPSTKTRPQMNPSLHPFHNTPRVISGHLTLPAFFKQTARPVQET